MTFQYHYIYLIITFFLCMYFIAIILNKDWVLVAGKGKYNFDYYIKIFGRTAVRVFIAILTIVGIVISFGAFYIKQTNTKLNNLTTNNMNVEDYFEKIRQDPHLAYPLLLGVAIFVLIGVIFDWDWLLDPQGSTKFRLQMELWGRKTVRIYLGAVLSIIIVLLTYVVCVS